MVVVVVMVVVRRLGFGFRAGREATRVNKLPPENGGGRESRGIVKARRQGGWAGEKRDRYTVPISGVAGVGRERLRKISQFFPFPDSCVDTQKRTS